MAFIGLARPFVAKLTQSTSGSTTSDAYSDGFVCGKLCKVSISPSFAEGSLYGDDTQVEYDKEFSNAAVTVETTYLPEEAQTIMLGHTKNETTSEIEYDTGDAGNYVGFGFYVHEKINGVKNTVGIILSKVKFSEGEDSFETKGESISYTTPSLSGSATGDSTGKWKYLKTFSGSTADADAETWIKSKLNITA